MSGNSETTRLERPGVPFVDLETGLTCLVLNYMGHWNGYVQIPEGHIFHGKTYSQCVKPDCKDRDTYVSDLPSLEGHIFDHCEHTAEAMLEVHGGVTWTGPLNEHSPNDEWWLGFDTVHFGDNPVNCNMNYVLQETLKLAKQLV